MSDIRWTPDENGVPMCSGSGCPAWNTDDCPEDKWLTIKDGDEYCYPQMVKIVEAAKRLTSERTWIGAHSERMAVDSADFDRLFNALRGR